MESRRSRRLILSLPAEIICGDRRYPGSIENISAEGIYLVTPATMSGEDLAPGTMPELRFRFLSGEEMHLHCRIKWSYPTPPHGYTNSLGLEIMDPPLTYKEILNTLK